RVGHELIELHEIGMGDVGERAELALEAVQRLGREMPERLQRNPRVPLNIANFVDHAEAALSETVLNDETLGSTELHCRLRRERRKNDPEVSIRLLTSFRPPVASVRLN